MIPVTIFGFTIGPVLAFKAPLISGDTVVPGKRKIHPELVAICNKPGCKLTESTPLFLPYFMKNNVWTSSDHQTIPVRMQYSERSQLC